MPAAKAQLLSYHEQLLHLLGWQFSFAPQQAGVEANLGKMLNLLHLEKGAKKITAHGERPMFLQQYGIMLFQVRPDAGR